MSFPYIAEPRRRLTSDKKLQDGMDRPAAAIKLDDHTLNRLAPVGVTQLAECTDLEQIGRAWRQVFHRNCLICACDRDRCKRGWRCSTRAGGRVTYFIETRFQHSDENHQQFALSAQR